MMRLECPNCGLRNVSEFHFRGACVARPRDGETPEQERAWAEYLYFRTNAEGVQKEWWYHRYGCRLWFLAERHTKSHAVERTYRWEATT